LYFNNYKGLIGLWCRSFKL